MQTENLKKRILFVCYVLCLLALGYVGLRILSYIEHAVLLMASSVLLAYLLKPLVDERLERIHLVRAGVLPEPEEDHAGRRHQLIIAGSGRSAPRAKPRVYASAVPATTSTQTAATRGVVTLGMSCSVQPRFTTCSCQKSCAKFAAP